MSQDEATSHDVSAKQDETASGNESATENMETKGMLHKNWLPHTISLIHNMALPQETCLPHLCIFFTLVVSQPLIWFTGSIILTANRGTIIYPKMYACGTLGHYFHDKIG